MTLNVRSEKNLTGVHPDLVKVVRQAATKADFIVTEGLRTAERQAELVAKGASKTTKSRHLTGHAVDLAALSKGQVVWDFPHYTALASIVKEAAKELDVPIEWGGDWTSFKDGPHFQLPWKEYPIS